MKKETLEEADEIITTTKFSWEQERMYSEKQMDDAYDKGFKDATERMYSEEDMKEAFIAGGNSQIEEDDAYGSAYFEYMEKWLEQFKKK